MNGRTENILGKFKPSMAIIVYKNEHDYYLESHAIDDAGKLLEGIPLMQETISGMVDIFMNDRMDSSIVTGLLPENVLHFSALPGGNYKMIWYRPAEKRHLYFVEGLHIPSGTSWVPPMLYMVEGNELSVYALHDNTRPKHTTVLYHAPYHNVSSAGVCLGSAKAKKPKERTYENLCKYWEDMFWLSKFTHLSGENPTKTNVNMLWIKCIQDNNITWADLDELIPMEGRKDTLTLKDIL